MLTAVETFWLHWQANQGDLQASATARAWLTALDNPTQSLALPASVLEQLPAPTLQDLLASVARDNPHVSGVAETAERLFDATRPLHQLRPAARRRLANAARLHHLAGPTTGDSAAALEARPLADVSLREQARLVALLRASAQTPAPRAMAAASPDPEVALLAALLQLADALDYDQDQTTRLESATLAPATLILRVRGLGAPATARRVQLCRHMVKQALAINLRVTVAPPSLDELRPLLNEPLTAHTTVARAVQRGLAGALLSWQTALASALTGDATLTNAERETAHLRQVLGLFRPVLKRKATHGLRRRLGHLQRRLRAAGSARAATADALAYAAALPAEATAQMQPLLEALDQSGHTALAEAEAWLNSPVAVEVCDDLLALVGAVPLRQGPDTALRQNAPELFKAALETIATRRAEYEEGDPERQRRLCEALVRGQATLEMLGGAATLGPMAEPLAADWQTVEQRTEAMRHLGALDDAIGTFLDEWALRQAKRKAPQLSGADAVLAYRHQRRVDRRKQRRALVAAWQPVTGRALAGRVKQILTDFEAGASVGGG